LGVTDGLDARQSRRSQRQAQECAGPCRGTALRRRTEEKGPRGGEIDRHGRHPREKRGSGGDRCGAGFLNSRPTKKLPNSQRNLPLVTSDKWGTCGMLRHCLIHPVAPLLSLLDPLLGPFRSPVRGLRSASTERHNPMTFLVFSQRSCAPHRAAEKFCPVIRGKTGQRTAPRRPRASVPFPEAWGASHGCR
jgi:hypothetical protein